MKLRALFTTLALGAACLTTIPASAQTVDPCTVYLCMAGISGFGASGGPACAPALAYWHAPTPAGLAVYHPPQGFNPPASAASREEYLLTCPGATTANNTAVLQAIMSTWGSVP
jgi:hypothetical protein